MNTMMTMPLLIMKVTVMIMAMGMVVTVVFPLSLITVPSAARLSNQRHWHQGYRFTDCMNNSTYDDNQ